MDFFKRKLLYTCRIHVEKLSRLFRGKFLAELKKLWLANKLKFPSRNGKDQNYRNYSFFSSSLYVKDWVVYTKKPFGGPEQVIKYLGRYTHRVAITNYRITNISDTHVSFLWKDYRTGKNKNMTLTVKEFMRRFLLHILPKGFVKIRSFGFLGNRVKKNNLALCRKQFGVESVDSNSDNPVNDFYNDAAENFKAHQVKCPKCGSTKISSYEIIPFFKISLHSFYSPPY